MYSCSPLLSDARSATTPPSPRTDSSKENKQPPKTGGIPNFEEYLDLATRNGWSPVDPVEKLLSISKQFSQVIIGLPMSYP